MAQGEEPLHAMFSLVPASYDRVNTVVTWGLDRRWRAAAARECLADGPRRLLDLCCGTGDLAIALAQGAQAGAEVSGLDFCRPMLEVARAKAARLPVQIGWVHGDAASLPFPEGHFDCVGISFAFRNLLYENPRTADFLAEILRVLRPGGRFVAVESSQPAHQPVRGLYRLYMRAFVAGLGGAISGQSSAYRYLGQSAARFYGPPQVERLLLDAGFATVRATPMLLGAVSLYSASKGG